KNATRAAFSSCGRALLAVPTIRNNADLDARDIAPHRPALPCGSAIQQADRDIAELSGRWQLVVNRVRRSVAGQASAQRFHVFHHTFPLLRVRHSSATGAEIVHHVLWIAGPRNDRRHGWMAKNEFQEKLSPARAIEFCRPVWQLLAESGAKQAAAAKRQRHQN